METPPLKPFLTIVSFLGIFVILVSTIPAGFMVTTDEYKGVVTQDEFSALDLQTFADTEVYTLNETGGYDVVDLYYYDFSIGGRSMTMIYVRANQTQAEYIRLRHKYTAYWFIPTAHTLDWYNSRGVHRSDNSFKALYAIDIEIDYSDNQPYRPECSHFTLTAYFGYNETLYSNVEDAWNNHALSVLLGIDFKNQETGMNVWNLIGMILFFQMPNIHFSINAIIAIPLWVCIAWLTFAFITAVLKSLPFT